jgi:hypothetical protein
MDFPFQDGCRLMIDTTNLGALTPWPEGGKSLRIPLDRTANGMAPWPRGAEVHVAPRGQGAMPLSTAQLKRKGFPTKVKCFPRRDASQSDGSRNAFRSLA